MASKLTNTHIPFPTPGNNCAFWYRNRYVNGRVMKVEITARGVWLIVRPHRGFKVRANRVRIQKHDLQGWTLTKGEIHVKEVQ